MRRERQRRGSTWKFQYDAQQAGYNLSYWVGDDQHWLRNKYRKYERRTSEDERIVENPIIERESEPDDTENNKLRSQLLKSLAEASTRREVTEIRSAILRINESRFKHDMKFEVTRAEQLIAELEKQPPEIGIDDRANKDDLNESDDSEELRERLHKAVWNETLDFVELRESADLFEAANLEDINGDLAKAHRMLQANIYVEGLRHGIEDRDLDVLETILGEIDFKQMKCEVGEIYDEAKNLIRKMTLERRNKNMALTLKRELARAMSNRNAPQIRNTLTNIRQAQLEQKLSDEVKAAERLLRELELETEELQKDMEEKNELERINKEVFRLQQLLQGAIDEGDISLLQSAIQSVIDSGLEDLLRSELSDANELLDKLKEKLAFRKSVAEIPARYVSEVRSYKNPPAGSLEVMQATFLLLGFDENNLKTWRDIQTHLGKGGTDSFRYRVVKRDTHVIDDHVVERAQDLLDEISLDDAQNLSLLVNLFYRYCQAVINESNPPNATNS
uniref:Uncharacterized protein LOC108950862 n=1 Tax=Phallusia mammillata TaxID=59560 RepID=A0A6F9DKB0_9ASCI|nr:uncharacterized protein LOC108950862 [Phallusia mammillata]